MKFDKMIILLTLVALVASRSLEGDNQTIGWGLKVEDQETIIGDGRLVLEMIEEEQSLGIGD